MCTATETAAPASTGEALAMVRAGLGYLADCDAGSLGTAAQAEALIGLERAEAQHTAARAKILAAFTAQQGYEADGYYGPASWLRAITKVTKGAAAAAAGWARRLDGHPVIAAALAQGQLPVSLARLICDWTDKLPEDLRADADGILLAAVLGGADQHDLARLGREMLDRAQTSPDRDSDGFEERALWLGTTFGGAGRLHADLTPACAAALTVVLEALGQKAGPEDTRTAAQRRHDAVEEACRRLISGQLIPGRDGQPPHLTVHIDLNDLRGGSVLERSWTPARAAAGPGSVYLTGPAAEAAACDAVVTPMVTGQIDWAVLDQLTTVWLTAHGHGPHRQPARRPPGPATGRPRGRATGKTSRTAGRKTTRTGHGTTTQNAQAGRPPARATGTTMRTGRGTTTRTGRGTTTRTGRGTTTRTGRGTTTRTGRRTTTRTGRGTTTRTGRGTTTRTGRGTTTRTGRGTTTRTGRGTTTRTGRGNDHPDGPRDDQADGRPESRDANQPAARTGHPPGSGPSPGPGPLHGYVPFPGTPRPRPRPRQGPRRRGRPRLRDSRLPGGHPAAAAGHHPALEPRPFVRARRARLPAARHRARRPVQYPQPAAGPRPHHPHHPAAPAHRRHPAG